ncbi:hypothetical protein FRB94_014699 [Tulasnella sp. JGI-2019a]|nr:hypothetical protein FRB94_014699 [Tulasnella sp. JGI-2019a]KAG9012788.1 hypothetical protein FRB93_001342 [Tulasnella sp. JGI-2019a]
MSSIRSMPDICSLEASPPLEVLEFRGGPNKDVSAFLGATKHIAIIQDRYLDDKWLASYTESGLRGDVLEWFDEMSSEVSVLDWRVLRKAFLCRFHRKESNPAYPPTPAAAANAAAVVAQRAEVAVVAAVEVVAALEKQAEMILAAGIEAVETVNQTLEVAVVAITEAAVAAVKKMEAATATATKSETKSVVTLDAHSKVLILGNSGVGKSCLLSRYLGHG